MIIELLVVATIFFIFSIFLTNFVIFSGGTTLFTMGVGDATSGFLWLLYANDGTSLWNGSTQLVNYPYGEPLGSPYYITWLLVLGPLWLLSFIFSPITALNIVMIAGFVSAGVATYYLLKKIIKSRFISFIGAYAVAFAPYHILKSPDHLTNIFIWPFIGIIGLLISFWRKQTWFRGLGLAISLAAAMYTDGYYIFIAAVLLVSLFVGLMLTDITYRVKLKDILIKIARLALVGLATVVLLLPIVLVQVSAGSEVSNELANSRGDIKNEVTYYSSKPIDFLLPPQENITVAGFGWYKELVEQKNERSNMGENTTYIGYAVLLLFLTGVAIGAYKFIGVLKNRQKQMYPSVQSHVLAISLITVPLILTWMLPPVVHALGFEIRTPIDLLTNYLALWRVPSRLFIVLHILVVIVAMTTLHILTYRLKVWKRWLILAVVLLLIVVDSYSTIKRPSFGLGNMPQTYSWLKTQDDIHAIAELPLIDRPIEVSGYYVFGQLIHSKPMVNTALARNDAGLLNPLGNLANDETINFLKRRNVDAVLVHDRACKPVSWGVLVHIETVKYSSEYIDKKADMLCTYKLNHDSAVDPLFTYLDRGFAKQNYLDESGRYWNPLNSSNSEMRVVDDRGEAIASADSAAFSFNVDSLGEYPKKGYRVSISQENKQIGAYDTSNSSSIALNINPAEEITLSIKTLDGFDIAPGEVGITSLEVSQLPKDL
jgi:hypothetical protein